MHHSRKDTFHQVEFRLATLADIDGLVELFHAFFSESTLPRLGLVYDPARMARWLEKVIGSGLQPHLIAIAKDSDEIVGSIDYVLDHSHTTAPNASLNRFYVRPHWRLSAIGRVLLDLMLEEAKADGAVAFRAGLSSGIQGARNLFVHAGFTPTPYSILLARKL